MQDPIHCVSYDTCPLVWARSTVSDCASRPEFIGLNVLLERPSALAFLFFPRSASSDGLTVLLKSSSQDAGNFLPASDKFPAFACQLTPKLPIKPGAYYFSGIVPFYCQQHEKSISAPRLTSHQRSRATPITPTKPYLHLQRAARPPPYAKGTSRRPIYLSIHVAVEKIKTSLMRLPAPRSSTTTTSARPKRQRNLPAHIPDQSFRHDYLGLLGLRVLSIDTDHFCIRVRAEQYPLFDKCPDCGCADSRFKRNGTRIQIVRDEPRGMRSVYVEIVRQSYYCRGCRTAIQHPLPRNR